MQNVQVARACNESKDVSIKFQLIVAGILPENILTGKINATSKNGNISEMFR